MSETGNQVPANAGQGGASPDTSSFEGLTEALWNAYHGGDKQRAEQFQRERDARYGDGAEGAEVGEGEGEGEAAPVDVPPAEQGVLDRVVEDWEIAAPELLREWGHDIGQNLGYAFFARDQIASRFPDFGGFLDQEFQLEDGTTFRPGDEPGLIWAAATLGRLLASRDGQSISAIPNTPLKKGQNMPSKGTQPRAQTASDAERLDTLTREMNSAFSRGDRSTANRLQAERERLAQRLYGNEPIVGAGGRNV